ARSRKYRYTFNSIGAGATIPKHLHFHVFQYDLPVEHMPVVGISEHNGLKIGRLDTPWPIVTWVIEGEKEYVRQAVWEKVNERQKQGKAFNLICLHNGQGGLKVYFIPRRNRAPKQTFTNGFGVFEAGGVIVSESTQGLRNAEEDEKGKKIAQALCDVGYPRNNSNTYPLPVPKQAHQEAVAKYGEGTIAKADATLTDRRYSLTPIIDSFEGDWQRVLETQSTKISQMVRGPPEFSIEVTTDLSKTEGNVASCDIPSKTVYIHPYYFAQT
ncbi:unnamed protein product, partial [marine sediment metagenome]